jgi:hypothetical protein
MGKTIISADGRFEWDEEKAQINLRARIENVEGGEERQRGVSFPFTPYP